MPKSKMTLAQIMYEQEEKDIENAINTLNKIAQNKSMSEKIKNAILAINKPFNKTDLFSYMKTFHGIENHKLICEVLDDLCESEIIRYVEIEDNCWAFVMVENTCR